MVWSDLGHLFLSSFEVVWERLKDADLEYKLAKWRFMFR
jgi:hypothetical protein